MKIARYYFDDIIKDININFSDILWHKKLYENISVYDVSYKFSMGSKPLHIRFYKMDGFSMVLDGKIKHLVLFDYGLFDKFVIRLNILQVKKVVL